MKYILEISHSREISWKIIDSFDDEQSARDALQSPTFECSEYLLCRILCGQDTQYTAAWIDDGWTDIGPCKYRWHYNEESIVWGEQRSLVEAWQTCNSPSWMIFGMDHLPRYYALKIAVELLKLAIPYEIDRRCRDTVESLQYDNRGVPTNLLTNSPYGTAVSSSEFVHYYATHPAMMMATSTVIINACDNVLQMLLSNWHSYEKAQVKICNAIRKCVTVYNLLDAR